MIMGWFSTFWSVGWLVVFFWPVSGSQPCPRAILHFCELLYWFQKCFCELTNYHGLLDIHPRCWWFQRFCYFYHRTSGEMIQRRIDHQVVWNDTWTYLEFWVLHCFFVFGIWQYTKRKCLCNLQSELESPKSLIFNKSGGWWFGIWGSM